MKISVWHLHQADRAMARVAVVMTAVVLCAVMLTGSVTTVHADTAASSRAAHQPAAEILEDGLAAIADGADELALETFNYLIRTYPRSPEAQRAKSERAKLAGASTSTGDDEANGWQSTWGADASRIDEYRRYFLRDVGDRVFFAESSADLGGRARAVVDAQAAWLKRRNDVIVTVVGRADDGGSEVAAVELAQRRASAVRNRMLELGIPATRIAIDARGARDPIALCKSALCRSQNRHAETVLSDPRSADTATLDPPRSVPSRAGGEDRNPDER